MLIVNKLDQFLRHDSPQLNYSINAADYVYSSCVVEFYACKSV